MSDALGRPGGPELMSIGMLDLVEQQSLPAPASSPTRLQSVLEALINQLESGDLAPGDPLPLSKLTEELRVASNTVREAISILTAWHLVEARPHKSSVVATPTTAWLAAVLAESAGLSSLAASLAIPRTTPDQRKEFRAAAEEAMLAWKAPVVDSRRASGMTWNLFQLLATYSRNQYLAAMHAEKKPALVFGFKYLGRDRNATMVCNAIEALLDAVENNDRHEGADIISDLYVYVLDDLSAG
ncbi:GntR family transcriptional regulator [Microbacterium sp. ISL-59]|uniref:GntR family transcriptional regulator n=1 Tax=Microbacterium sp. ISL-59 TaxID=2819159 RepID=UPI001BEB1E91|nr:GntR family transcriptional regulator [Microbacterium sp. ISL-59]MBT2495829.1 GntR family transcriptional regulator [Microbacterium sp. ISL-59]